MREERIEKIADLLFDYPLQTTPAETIEAEFDKIVQVLRQNRIEVTKSGYEEEFCVIRYFVILEKKKWSSYLGSDCEYHLAEELDAIGRIRIYFDWNKQAMALEVPKKKYDYGEVAEHKPSVLGLKKLLLEPIENENAGGRYATSLYAGGKLLPLDIRNAPNIVIGGASGSGKSCFLDATLISLMARYTSSEIKFLLIDYKRVEFQAYEGLSYLIGKKVLHGFDESLSALEATAQEIDNRFEIFTQLSVRNITEYNEKAEELGLSPMAHIFIVIDEFADAMMLGKKKIQDVLLRLMMRGRAAGGHVCISTQRVCRDVLTSSITAFCPTKIAFFVSAAQDSRVLLEEDGAQFLLSHGEALFKGVTSPKAIRAQSAYISAREVQKVTSYLRTEK